MIKIDFSELTRLQVKLKSYKGVSLKQLEPKINAAYKAEVEANFANQSDGDGNKWARLASSTLKQRKRLGAEGNPILQLRGVLKAAALNPQVNADDNLFAAKISDDKLARIAGFIQGGTSKMPARPFITVSTRLSERVNQIVSEAQVNNLKEALSS